MTSGALEFGSVAFTRHMHMGPVPTRRQPFDLKRQLDAPVDHCCGRLSGRLAPGGPQDRRGTFYRRSIAAGPGRSFFRYRRVGRLRRSFRGVATGQHGGNRDGHPVNLVH